jgi:hypothetical protein
MDPEREGHAEPDLPARPVSPVVVVVVMLAMGLACCATPFLFLLVYLDPPG